MQIKELKNIDDMLSFHEVISELYPKMTIKEYEAKLIEMIPHNYKQAAVFDDQNRCLGISGFWIGNKLWCGKYMELDNIIIMQENRSSGAGSMLFNYLKEKAVKIGCNIMTLDSYSTNFKAHKFFYNKGFAPKGFHFVNILNENGIR